MHSSHGHFRHSGQILSSMLMYCRFASVVVMPWWVFHALHLAYAIQSSFDGGCTLQSPFVLCLKYPYMSILSSSEADVWALLRRIGFEKRSASTKRVCSCPMDMGRLIGLLLETGAGFIFASSLACFFSSITLMRSFTDSVPDRVAFSGLSAFCACS